MSKIHNELKREGDDKPEGAGDEQVSSSRPTHMQGELPLARVGPGPDAALRVAVWVLVALVAVACGVLVSRRPVPVIATRPSPDAVPSMPVQPLAASRHSAAQPPEVPQTALRVGVWPVDDGTFSEHGFIMSEISRAASGIRTSPVKNHQHDLAGPDDIPGTAVPLELSTPPAAFQHVARRASGRDN